MSMEKYGDSSSVVATLMKMKLCETEEEALEKVASGTANGMIREFKLKLLEDMISVYETHTEISDELADEFAQLKKEVEGE
mgnify:CR=1 FL=1|tara:strand:- start:1439 stop:1681 length:243 start_codon:yes stop_codon:yes gene_type:complete